MWGGCVGGGGGLGVGVCVVVFFFFFGGFGGGWGGGGGVGGGGWLGGGVGELFAVTPAGRRLSALAERTKSNLEPRGEKRGGRGDRPPTDTALEEVLRESVAPKWGSV